MIIQNPMLAIDAYKFGHMAMHPANIANIYINMTPRSMKYFNRLIPEQFQDNKLVSFGVEMAIKDITEYFEYNFFNRPLDEVLNEYISKNYKICSFSTSFFNNSFDSFSPIWVY